MRVSAISYGLLLLQGAMASPVAEAAPEVEPRNNVERRDPTPFDIPFPQFPKKGKGGNKGGTNCPASNQMSNSCSSGAPYCCTSDGKGGHVCQNTTACTSTVICCNNNNGFQICIGDLDFNMPITINIYE